jgi:hypothetical protein
MENSTGSITPFVTGILPKEKYSDVNEFAKDLASVFRIDEDRIVVDLIALESLKGEKGEEGPRGLKGDTGAKGDKGDTGTPGTSGLSAFETLVINPTLFTTTWNLSSGINHYNASLTLIEGSGAIQLIFTGISSGMHGTLKLKQNLACNGVLQLPANSRFPAPGFLISHADPGGTPPVPVPSIPFTDVLNWIYDGTHFLWTIHYDFTTPV